jgi:hypothetical protein
MNCLGENLVLQEREETREELGLSSFNVSQTNRKSACMICIGGRSYVSRRRVCNPAEKMVKTYSNQLYEEMAKI